MHFKNINKHKSGNFLFIVLLIILAISCKTYNISPDNFRTQMIHANTKNLQKVEINNSLTFYNITYYSNNIKSLIVHDKKGNEVILENSPSIEMKVTHKSGKNYYFYFDTVIIENDTLKGGRSRFIQSLTREIPMDSILRIEIQDGGKKFDYQN